MPMRGAHPDLSQHTAKRLPKLLKPADLPDNFTRSLYKIAPYRGCGHGCRYCDGRAERYYVEGNFERDIEIRHSIPERLASELPSVRESGMIGFGSGVTDPYQPIEAIEKISGRCASLLAESPNPLPALVMTKSCLPLRDLEAWTRVNERAGFVLLVSITSLDENLRTCMEPGASSFIDRIKLLKAFKEAGCITGVLAMPFLPGLSDSLESIRSLYSECIDSGVDFIMPGGLTLRPGRQKACYLKTVSEIDPALFGQTIRSYKEDRLSGMPTHRTQVELHEKISQIQKELDIPFLLPHRVFAKFLPPFDALRILFRDMIELFHGRGIDTTPLLNSADNYDEWLISIKREFRKKRSLPDHWLEERFLYAFTNNELSAVFNNNKLTPFVSAILQEGARLNYTNLRLE
jgi:DNA repair photolyase